jgi:putative Mn2+ efflux pump MntP
MEFLTLFLIALSLSFDTFAVSVTTGLIIKNIQFKQAVKIAIVLALVQSIMPFLGWYMGILIKDLIIDYDHWLAFILLSIIGGKMIYESLKKEEESKNFNPEKLSVLITIAIATSIDALIVGITFAFINIDILFSAILIGSITFLAGMLGMLLGKNIGNKLGKKPELIGGIILIGIGVKILLEHLFF